MHVFEHLSCGLRMPIDFNDGISIFPPKGEEAGDDVDFIRDPGNTRPLTLKNTDNKLIATVTNTKIKSTLSTKSNAIQQGFIHGRTFLKNIVEIDTSARLMSNESLPGDLPCLAFFDYANAFGSVMHSWIFLVLSESGWPSGFINLIRGIYNICSAYTSVGGVCSFMCMI